MAKTCVICGFGSLGAGSWFKEVQKQKSFDCIGVIDSDTELLGNLGNFGLSEDHASDSIDDCVADGCKPDLVIVATPVYLTMYS